jgi:hypothetical protein
MRKLMASAAAAALIAGVGAGGALAATGHNPDQSSSRDRVSHVGHREHSSSQDRSRSRTDRASRDRETPSRSR